MAEVELIACVAVDVCSGQQITVLLAQQLGRSDPQAISQVAQQQRTVLGQLGDLQKSLADSTKKLQAVWSVGSATAGMASTMGQLSGAYAELVNHGSSLAQQLEAAAKLLQDAQRIMQLVKAANASCAALMSNPWTMGAAKALGSVTAVQVTAWIAVVAQAVMAIGQVLTLIQRSTQTTNNTTTAIGQALTTTTTPTTPATTTPLPTMPVATMPVATMPPTPTPVPATATGYPTYPTYPTVVNPQTGYPAAPTNPVAPGYPTAPAYPTAATPAAQAGLPTVYDSGWLPKDPGTAGAAAPADASSTAAGGATAGAGTTGDHLTISITENSDGKYDLKVDVPDSELGKDLKINVDANVGGQEIKGSFDV
jgi:hypothetical protein